ncbi:glycosyltransferase (plasmid) [Deltaproteobacteria bacterium Smac51]|nr:glycosyltransferase [Deltaproteobacteria bacterium Smac51]
MKIAVLAPSPVPFVIGGVENMAWSLCDTINKKTDHIAELVKVVSKESGFWELIDSYQRFDQLDLDHFDLVITMKYPGWMINHDNVLCYTCHCLRGLYDTYNADALPLKPKPGNPYIDRVLKYIRGNPQPASLNRFFSLMELIKVHQDDIPSEYFNFPGPFIRELVHFMDQAALSRPGVKKFCAISETVKARKEYFPPKAEVTAIHLPPPEKNCRCGKFQHIFMVSRLDPPKRIDMLIKAMGLVKSDVKLYIAGTGPQEKQLRQLAAGDERIEFLGFVSDEEVENYYADSLVVPYFPYDEDLGLITLEAMMHKKPVITTEDAGGPTEFVINGETGYCTPFEAGAIAEKIDYLAANPQEARRMGEKACEKVRAITWQRTVEELLKDVPGRGRKNTDRKKLTVVTTYNVYPPKGGGQSRVYNLYKCLADDYDIEIVSLMAGDPDLPSVITPTPGLTEIRVFKTPNHIEMDRKMKQKAGDVAADDIVAMSVEKYTPKYMKSLAESVEKADAVMLEHPYLIHAVRQLAGDKPVFFTAHNVEYLMKKDMYSGSAIKDEIVGKVFEAEKESCEYCTGIFTCSEDDARQMQSLYNIPPERFVVVPNGVSSSDIVFTDIEQRRHNQYLLGLAQTTVGLFIGSWHEPNIEAARIVIELAGDCPEVMFLLMGSQCDYFNGQKKRLPKNVGLLGVVEDSVKQRVLATVDFALNPMKSGSGTNLKMFDYMASGVPIITTDFGARGIDDKGCFIVAEPEQMSGIINSFSLDDCAGKIAESRRYVETVFDWYEISRAVVELVG